jgi:hypothetical protein
MMTGKIRFFEKDANGRLTEVDPEKVDAERRFASASLLCNILFTPDEEAARDAEEAQAQLDDAQKAADKQVDDAAKTAAMQKLAALGITAEDLDAILKP